MAEVENIRDWQGKDVLDSDGRRSTVEDVYFDVETDEPRFLRVKAGWLRHLVFVAGVAASPDHLTVAVTKGVAEKAPAMEPGALERRSQAMLRRSIEQLTNPRKRVADWNYL